ncbi:hypothetical protein [Parasitella parasitica]|uniref:Uncharacterized protein n=1 Tax=Parasitella parasitica TaxID=35722 RepID=A0A0B7NAF7_9FUNG|nr:hypothetical protein [Parasitella parasitica]
MVAEKISYQRTRFSFKTEKVNLIGVVLETIRHWRFTLKVGYHRNPTWVVDAVWPDRSKVYRPKIIYHKEEGYWIMRDPGFGPDAAWTSRTFFKAGSNKSGLGKSEDMLKQLKEDAIPPFVKLHFGRQAIFLFGNSSDHSAFPKNALLASRLTLNDASRSFKQHNREDIVEAYFDLKNRQYSSVNELNAANTPFPKIEICIKDLR